MEIITRKEAKAQGLKRYFTGKPCKRGHVSTRLVSNKACAECKRLHNRQYHAENREYFRQYREENRERIVEKNRQYREENRERIVEKNRQYYAENREKMLEHDRQWREENREYYRQYRRQHYAENRERMLEKNRQFREENPEYFSQYYDENREKRLEYGRQYYAENREKRLEYDRQHREENRGLYRAKVTKRRAAKLQRTLSHEEELTQFVMEEAAQQAEDMGAAFGMPFHVDHMIPMQGRKVSGLHVWYNLQVIPAHLNISKGNRMRYTKPLEWLADAA